MNNEVCPTCGQHMVRIRSSIDAGEYQPFIGSPSISIDYFECSNANCRDWNVARNQSGDRITVATELYRLKVDAMAKKQWHDLYAWLQDQLRKYDLNENLDDYVNTKAVTQTIKLVIDKMKRMEE